MCAACFEAGVEIAGLVDVALALVADRALERLEDLRRVGGHGLLDVRDVLHHVVGDLDQPSGVDRLLFGVGRDGGDRIALIHRPGRSAPSTRARPSRRARGARRTGPR